MRLLRPVFLRLGLHAGNPKVGWGICGPNALFAAEEWPLSARSAVREFSRLLRPVFPSPDSASSTNFLKWYFCTLSQNFPFTPPRSAALDVHRVRCSSPSATPHSASLPRTRDASLLSHLNPGPGSATCLPRPLLACCRCRSPANSFFSARRRAVPLSACTR